MNRHNKTGTESQIQRTNRWLPEERGVREGEKQVTEIEVQTSSCNINESQG